MKQILPRRVQVANLKSSAPLRRNGWDERQARHLFAQDIGWWCGGGGRQTDLNKDFKVLIDFLRSWYPLPSFPLLESPILTSLNGGQRIDAGGSPGTWVVSFRGQLMSTATHRPVPVRSNTIWVAFGSSYTGIFENGDFV